MNPATWEKELIQFVRGHLSSFKVPLSGVVMAEHAEWAIESFLFAYPPSAQEPWLDAEGRIVKPAATPAPVASEQRGRAGECEHVADTDAWYQRCKKCARNIGWFPTTDASEDTIRRWREMGNEWPPAALSATAPPTDATLRSETEALINFLLGTHALNGVWFGQMNESRRMWWWRPLLRDLQARWLAAPDIETLRRKLHLEFVESQDCVAISVDAIHQSIDAVCDRATQQGAGVSVPSVVTPGTASGESSADAPGCGDSLEHRTKSRAAAGETVDVEAAKSRFFLQATEWRRRGALTEDEMTKACNLAYLVLDSFAQPTKEPDHA